MTCIRFPGGIVCVPDVTEAVVMVKGRAVRFEFDERFGPLVLTRDGRPAKRQPVSEHHPFWAAFEAWNDARRGLPPKCPRCCGEGVVTAAILAKRTAVGKTCPCCKGAGRVASLPSTDAPDKEK